MQNVQAGADYSGSKVLSRAPQSGNCLLLNDLTGGVEAVALEANFGGITMSKSGSPTFKRQGVVLDATNYLGTTLNATSSFDTEEMTICGVFYRNPTTMYFGNFGNALPNDSLLESTGLTTRFRFQSSDVNVNVDPPNPCPIGAPFFFGATCTAAGVTAVVGYLGRLYTASSASARDHDSTRPFRVGSGPDTAFTDSPFIACGVGLWDAAIGVSGLAEVYAWFRNRHELIGVNY
jgi:hypothetical protein